MKFTDQRDAKLTIWARASQPIRTPRIGNVPPFSAQKFSNYQEFNAWKRALQSELIRNGGAQWIR
jgi:hypothetical protein